MGTLVMEPDSVTLSNPVQSQNAHGSILVTELGMVTLVSPPQSLNAPSPIAVTEAGMSIDFNPLQPEYLQVVLYQ